MKIKYNFPSSKIDFWPFLKLQKMAFGQKKFSAFYLTLVIENSTVYFYIYFT